MELPKGQTSMEEVGVEPPSLPPVYLVLPMLNFVTNQHYLSVTKSTPFVIYHKN